MDSFKYPKPHSSGLISTNEAVSVEDYPFMVATFGYNVDAAVSNVGKFKTIKTLDTECSGFKTEQEAINYAKLILRDNDGIKVFVYKATKLIEMSAYSIKTL